jgi:hypothetical protein
MKYLKRWLHSLSPRTRLIIMADLTILALFANVAAIFLTLRGLPVPLWLLLVS